MSFESLGIFLFVILAVFLVNSHFPSLNWLAHNRTFALAPVRYSSVYLSPIFGLLTSFSVLILYAQIQLIYLSNDQVRYSSILFHSFSSLLENLIMH